MGHSKTRRHIVIPDTQVRPGVPTSHLAAAGNYIAEWRPEVIVHLGDHWDFPSLSSHKDLDVLKKGYKADVEAGNEGLRLLTDPWRKIRGYRPRAVLLGGNHDDYSTKSDNNPGRPARLLIEKAEMREFISLDDLNFKALGWEYSPFLKPIQVDGILYAHYFYSPQSGRPYGGTALHKLTKIHQSYTMGHQQGLDVARVSLPSGRTIRGTVAGSFYQHEEGYIGPQANSHWRGILVKHGVKDGNFDLMEVSMEYLLKKYA